MIFEFITDNPLINWLLFIFYITFFIQFLFYWIVFSRISFYKNKNIPRDPQPVSVIICAKNEYHNLKENLPLILEQNYQDFEIIVVNDASDDETYFLLKILSEKYPHLKIVNLIDNVNFFKGKKFPLSIGIKSAKNDIILLTDADCQPTSNNWILRMQENFYSGTEIVLGYGKYKEENNFLNKLIRFDTLHIAIQYLSLALSGIPYMGVGRNLSYRKTLFYREKGFIKHYKIKSGDDDLFINSTANRKNTKIMISYDSHTISEPKRNFKNWIIQKRRHLTSAKHYSFISKFLLVLYNFTQIVFFITFVSLMLFKNTLIIIFALFFLRLISQLIIFKFSMIKLNEKNLLLGIPFFEIFFILFNPILLFYNTISKPDKWK